MTPTRALRPLAAILALFCTLSATAAPIRVDLVPVDHSDAILTMVEPDGDVVAYDPVALEALGTWRLTTRTPWRETPARFDGVLLSELLARHDLSEASAILVTAENDYEVRIPREAWEGLEFLVATRVNDQPHSRRERGPIQFVLDEKDLASPLYSENYLVWMAMRIEADGP